MVGASIARALIGRKHPAVQRPLQMEQACTTRRMKRIYDLGGSAFHDLTGLGKTALLRRFARNRQIARSIVRLTSRGPTLCGYYILYPITKQCEELIREGRITKGSEIKLEHICRTFNEGTAVYVSLLYGLDRHARGDVIGMVRKRLSAIAKKNPNLQAVYARPCTDDGLRVVLKYRLAQLDDNPGIYTRAVHAGGTKEEDILRSGGFVPTVRKGEEEYLARLASFEKWKAAYWGLFALGCVSAVVGITLGVPSLVALLGSSTRMQVHDSWSGSGPLAAVLAVLGLVLVVTIRTITGKATRPPLPRSPALSRHGSPTVLAAAPQPITAIIARGESQTLEFKSSARWDVRQGKPNVEMENNVVKTVAAFLNSHGGTLLIGVDDQGSVLGLENDYKTLGKKQNRDQFENWLMTKLLGAYGKDVARLINITFHELEGFDVCQVDVGASPRTVFVKAGDGEHLYVRAGNSTRLLTTREAIDYHRARW
jgi:hypothetical protein